MRTPFQRFRKQLIPWRFVMLALVATNCFVAATVRAQDAPRPHMVYLLTDDLGWTDVGYHDSVIKTANLDRLAMTGTRLEQFYVQPVCSPTRGALMTGRYPARLGLQVGVVRPWASHGLPLEERTLAAALREVGYATAISGKWHLGHFERAYLPTKRGFDHQYGHYNGALDYFTHIRDGGFDWHRDDQVSRDEGYTTNLIGAEAVKRIENHDPSQPLFLYVPFNAPHSPLQAPQEYIDLYKDIPNERRRIYAAMVHCVDDNVGRIVDALEARGMRENTLIFFSSDNGGPIQLGATNGPLRAGKGTLYEGGVRVPAFVNWPGRTEPGSVVNEPLHIVDVYPTLLKLAGAPLAQSLPLDGHDAWPTITEGKPSPHEDILLNTTPFAGAIRRGDWKLVVNGRGTVNDTSGPDGQSHELFNLADDPYEKMNLAKSEPQRLEELRAALEVYVLGAAEPNIPPNRAPRGFKSPEIWGE